MKINKDIKYAKRRIIAMSIMFEMIYISMFIYAFIK